MMADAELIVSPEIDRNRLNRTLRTIEQGFNRVSRNIGRSIEQSIRQGIERAGGARGIAGSVGRRGAQGLFGAAVAGLFASSTRADNVTALYQQFLGQSEARNDLLFANAQGLDPQRYANFRRLGNRAGLDSSAINSLIFDTNARIGESVTGEDNLLRQFQGLQGVEAVGQVLGSISQMGTQEQSRYLDAIYGGEAGIEAQRLIQLARESIGEGATGQQIADFISRTDASAEQLLVAEAEATKNYRDQQAAREMEMRDAMLNALNKGDLELLLEQEQITQDATLEQIAAYDENLKTKQIQDEALKTLMDTLSDAVNNKLIPALDSLIAILPSRGRNPSDPDTRKQIVEDQNNNLEAVKTATGNNSDFLSQDRWE